MDLESDRNSEGCPENGEQQSDGKKRGFSIETCFRGLCGKSPVPMWICDAGSLEFLDANEAAVELLGYSGHDYRRMTVSDICAEVDPRRLAIGRPIQARMKAKRGVGAVLELRASRSYFGGRDAMLITGSSKGMAVAMEERMGDLERIVSLVQVALIVMDVDNRVILWNKRAEMLYGWAAAEAIGRTLPEVVLVDEALFEKASETVREVGEWEGEMMQKTHDGREVAVRSRWTLIAGSGGSIKAILVANIDITDQKNLEAQYLRAQRLESIGTLASGIAHDLNNILTPILMSTGILQRRHQDGESQKLLGAIEGSAERGADIVRQVLTFARGVAGERMLLQPRHIINELAKILGQTFPKDITIKSDLPRDLWMIPGDATQLHQILLNLCVNSRDAMPNGGNLHLAAKNVVFGREEIALHPEANPGPHVEISVRDTGGGIPEDVLPRIFEPFFTTKEQGKGTGLGLATVRGLVKSHAGTLSVESRPGQGTKFLIYLPASPHGTAALDEKKNVEIKRGNGEAILVVDDELAVRSIAARTLEANGYRVFLAEDGSDGLTLLMQRPGEIDVVITDVVMEQVNGLRLAETLRRRSPNVPIIVSSGQYTAEQRAVFQKLAVEAFLDKPYRPEQLLQTVSSVIVGRKSS
jgi:PAS domain S-box-containing protein